MEETDPAQALPGKKQVVETGGAGSVGPAPMMPMGMPMSPTTPTQAVREPVAEPELSPLAPAEEFGSPAVALVREPLAADAPVTVALTSSFEPSSALHTSAVTPAVPAVRTLPATDTCSCCGKPHEGRETRQFTRDDDGDRDERYDHDHAAHHRGDHEHADHDDSGYDDSDYDDSGYDRGDHDRGDYRRGENERGDHERGDHERGDHERGDHDRSEHDRGDHERGDHDGVRHARHDEAGEDTEGVVTDPEPTPDESTSDPCCACCGDRHPGLDSPGNDPDHQGGPKGANDSEDNSEDNSERDTKEKAKDDPKEDSKENPKDSDDCPADDHDRPGDKPEGKPDGPHHGDDALPPTSPSGKIPPTSGDQPPLPHQPTTPHQPTAPNQPTTPQQSTSPQQSTTPQQSNNPHQPTTPGKPSTPAGETTPGGYAVAKNPEADTPTTPRGTMAPPVAEKLTPLSPTYSSPKAAGQERQKLAPTTSAGVHTPARTSIPTTPGTPVTPGVPVTPGAPASDGTPATPATAIAPTVAVTPGTTEPGTTEPGTTESGTLPGRVEALAPTTQQQPHYTSTQPHYTTNPPPTNQPAPGTTQLQPTSVTQPAQARLAAQTVPATGGTQPGGGNGTYNFPGTNGYGGNTGPLSGNVGPDPNIKFDEAQYTQLMGVIAQVSTSLDDATSIDVTYLDAELKLQPSGQTWEPAVNLVTRGGRFGGSVDTETTNLAKTLSTFHTALESAKEVFKETDDLAAYDATRFSSDYPGFNSGGLPGA